MSRRLPVRRRILIPSSSDDEVRNENFWNAQKELFSKEQDEKSKQWHYDFKEDRPLPGEGNVRWFENQNGLTIGEKNNGHVAVDPSPSELSNQNVGEEKDVPNSTTNTESEENQGDQSDSSRVLENDDASVKKEEGTPIKDSPPRKKIKD